jgi:hypothetical protein
MTPQRFGPGCAHPALAETSSMLMRADAWVKPMLCAIAAGGALMRQGCAHATGERCGMVIDRAAATGAVAGKFLRHVDTIGLP